MRATTHADLFAVKLQELPYTRNKLVLCRKSNNGLAAGAEIRFMPVQGGGFRYSVANINSMNQRGSGRYTNDPVEAAIWAIDEEKVNGSDYTWHRTPESEHTFYSDYHDAVPLEE